MVMSTHVHSELNQRTLSLGADVVANTHARGRGLHLGGRVEDNILDNKVSNVLSNASLQQRTTCAQGENRLCN